MTTTTTPTHRSTGMGTAIASEWTKLWSVRSTWWSFVGALALMMLLSLSFGLDTAHPPPGASREDALLQVQDASALGMILAQFALIALATLTVTGEFASGSMLATLQWEPRRERVLLAKVAVVAPVVFVSASAMMLLAAVGADLTAGDYGVFVASDVVEISLRTGLYVALASVLAAGIGCILRSTAGTLTMIFLLLMLLPMMLGPLELPVVSTIGDYLPGTGGMHYASSAQMVGLSAPPYSTTQGLIVLVAWAAATLGAGLMVLRRRDV